MIRGSWNSPNQPGGGGAGSGLAGPAGCVDDRHLGRRVEGRRARVDHAVGMPHLAYASTSDRVHRYAVSGSGRGSRPPGRRSARRGTNRTTGPPELPEDLAFGREHHLAPVVPGWRQLDEVHRGCPGPAGGERKHVQALAQAEGSASSVLAGWTCGVLVGAPKMNTAMCSGIEVHADLGGTDRRGGRAGRTPAVTGLGAIGAAIGRRRQARRRARGAQPSGRTGWLAAPRSGYGPPCTPRSISAYIGSTDDGTPGFRPAAVRAWGRINLPVAMPALSAFLVASGP